MTFDAVKKLALFLLENYEVAWRENAALRSIIRSVPMSDGSKGVQDWERLLADLLANEEANKISRDRFAPIYDLIRQARQESDLLELLRKVPPVGGVQ